MKTEKITAVEWLFYRMIMDKSLSEKADFMHEAKEMEKEQIKNAFVECWKANAPDGIECKLDAEQYYNETFKSK